jgi:hypothetical protein
MAVPLGGRAFLLGLAALVWKLEAAWALPGAPRGILGGHWAVPLETGGVSTTKAHPTSADCDELYFSQVVRILTLQPRWACLEPLCCRWQIDHFSFYKAATSDGGLYQQRYFICNQKYWSRNGPIFFYVRGMARRDGLIL